MNRVYHFFLPVFVYALFSVSTASAQRIDNEEGVEIIRDAIELRSILGVRPMDLDITDSDLAFTNTGPVPARVGLHCLRSQRRKGRPNLAQSAEARTTIHHGIRRLKQCGFRQVKSMLNRRTRHQELCLPVGSGQCDQSVNRANLNRRQTPHSGAGYRDLLSYSTNGPAAWILVARTFYFGDADPGNHTAPLPTHWTRSPPRRQITPFFFKVARSLSSRSSQSQYTLTLSSPSDRPRCRMLPGISDKRGTTP